MSSKFKAGDVIFFANEDYAAYIFGIICKPDFGDFGNPWRQDYVHFIDAHMEVDYIDPLGGIVVCNIYDNATEENARELCSMLRPDADWSIVEKLSKIIKKRS